MDGFKRAGGLVDKSRFKRRPRYTVVLHDVREKLGLSLNTYVVIDSIHKLSTSDPKYPYCIMSKPNMAEFLQLGERTVYRSLNEVELLNRDDDLTGGDVLPGFRVLVAELFE